MSATETENLYEVLQVSPNAEPEVIEAAYRRLARKYHPDVSSSPIAAERMRELAAAYEVLRNGSRRAAYDAAFTPARPATSTARRRRTRGRAWRVMPLTVWTLAAVLLVIFVAL